MQEFFFRPNPFEAFNCNYGNIKITVTHFFRIISFCFLQNSCLKSYFFIANCHAVNFFYDVFTLPIPTKINNFKYFIDYIVNF
jgi:hypothetical protein